MALTGAERARRYRERHPYVPVERDGYLLSLCWCENEYVLVPVAEVRQCRTRPCNTGCEAVYLDRLAG